MSDVPTTNPAFRRMILPVLLAAATLATAAREGPAAADLPRVVEVCPVTEQVIAVRIQTGRVERSRLEPYVAEPGDRIEEVRRGGHLIARRLERGGRFEGHVTGRAADVLLVPDRYSGVPLDAAAASAVESYAVTSPDDPAYAEPRRPDAVHRKAKPNLFARTESRVEPLTTVYLRLPERLREGASYTVSFPALGADRASVTTTRVPARTRSEAVHVNQNGFAPSDLVKRAYVSLWMGDGGGLVLPGELRYRVVDDASGRAVLEGGAGVHWPAAKPEWLGREANLVGADVYRLDFPELTVPGRYRVVVDGVGSSDPFPVRPGVWEEAFVALVRGIFHHRSGIALGPPHTDYVRPRPHHPEDGVRVVQSRATLLDTDMGLDLGGRSSFEALAAEATAEELPGAWGGMMDAGDWDRRVQHLVIPRLLMEAYELAPEHLGRVNLRIPESGDAVPDVLDEGLWILDLWMRLQKPDGGVGGGIESLEHPAPGDVSWTDLLPLYAYAPDFWSTHEFAATAARAARVLAGIAPERSAAYRVAAERAMVWAERAYVEWRDDPGVGRRPDEVRDARNLAALELHALSGDERWHDVFAEDSLLAGSGRLEPGLRQREALFAYVRLPEGLGSAGWRAKARAALVADAEACLAYAEGNAFSIATPQRTREPFLGFLAGPVDGAALVRGHFLTGDPRYLAGAQAASQFGLGANPDNLSFTVGLGVRNPQWVLHEDSLKTGRRAPEGTMVYGPFDTGAAFAAPGTWWLMHTESFQLDGRKMHPHLMAWPPLETYVDMWNYVAQNEYTPWQTMAPSAYVWGYLAAKGG